MTRKYITRRKSPSRKQIHRKTYKGGRDTNIKGKVSKMKKRHRRSSTCRVKGTCSLIV